MREIKMFVVFLPFCVTLDASPGSSGSKVTHPVTGHQRGILTVADRKIFLANKNELFEVIFKF